MAEQGQVLEFRIPRGERIPRETLQLQVAMQAQIRGYQQLIRENGIVIEQMLAMGYQLPAGLGLDSASGWVLPVESGDRMAA